MDLELLRSDRGLAQVETLANWGAVLSDYQLWLRIQGTPVINIIEFLSSIEVWVKFGFSFTNQRLLNPRNKLIQVYLFLLSTGRKWTQLPHLWENMMTYADTSSPKYMIILLEHHLNWTLSAVVRMFSRILYQTTEFHYATIN